MLFADEEGRGFFKNSRSKRNSAFSRRRRSNSARSSASSTAPVSPEEALDVAGAPNAQHCFTNTNLRGYMSHRAAGLNHQAGSLLPKLRVYLRRLPTYGHPSRGTSSPTSRVSTIRGQLQLHR
ncbi:hypothetical protein I553_9254 [Mycobacterium xenopi 4042]|uniref:Uncharacterized protein n=1 Tax=Mycobacterium xenopi 4042 TaxID=1299334 RepID=X8A8Y9_MYCXE|nr:hypothetical protein I553_9254 [Mycobacterium xenopi 4042]